MKRNSQMTERAALYRLAKLEEQNSARSYVELALFGVVVGFVIGAAIIAFFG